MGGGSSGSGTSASPMMSSMADYNSQMQAQQNNMNFMTSLGKGMDQFGQGISQGAQASTIGGFPTVPSMGQQQFGSTSGPAELIPVGGGGEGGLMDALTQILSRVQGGGY